MQLGSALIPCCTHVTAPFSHKPRTNLLYFPAVCQVDEKPTEDYSDIGGLDKQITELVEAVVLPVTHKERFKSLGIRPPKGVLLYGPPGTGWSLPMTCCNNMVGLTQHAGCDAVSAHSISVSTHNSGLSCAQ